MSLYSASLMIVTAHTSILSVKKVTIDLNRGLLVAVAGHP